MHMAAGSGYGDGIQSELAALWQAVRRLESRLARVAPEAGAEGGGALTLDEADRLREVLRAAENEITSIQQGYVDF